jgi:hypothetical protein
MNFKNCPLKKRQNLKYGMFKFILLKYGTEKGVITACCSLSLDLISAPLCLSGTHTFGDILAASFQRLILVMPYYFETLIDRNGARIRMVREPDVTNLG